MAGSNTDRYGVPLATYRLQLRPGFGFAEAARIVPYLARLGISHVYLSPFFETLPGSEHGYDIVDHNQVRREIGGLAGLYGLGEALEAHGMGLIADFVPNHMGIGNTNPWWMDVLRYGRESPHAQTFDIDWEAQVDGAIRYPILRNSFEAALEAGDLRLELVDGDVTLRYLDHGLPLAPRSYARVFGVPPLSLGDELHDPATLAAMVETLAALLTASRPEAEHRLGALRSVLAAEPALREWAAQSIRSLNGTHGDRSSFDALEAILAEQTYRLTDWRTAGEGITYRRFFDNTCLAGIRVERDEVFDDIHRLLLELVAKGVVTGVRIDHVDGLYKVGDYLGRLRRRVDEAAAGLGGVHVPIYVEKILARGERLPPWPVDGATGYEFAAETESLFVDRGGEGAMTAAYQGFIGVRHQFAQVAYESRLHMEASTFGGELNALAVQLHDIARQEHTLGSLQRAIAVVMACFPVYRTYVSQETDSARFIGRAIDEAASRDDSLSPEALDFLREVLLVEGRVDAEKLERRVHFRRRFQQLTGPIMAKGLEDTAFYRYLRLISLNEVGGDPSRFGAAANEVHAWLQQRARDWPAALSATTTHDTKRSEDVRCRLHVLSEIPDTWRREVRAWRRLNDHARTAGHGKSAPDPSTEYYLYQTLVGAWEGEATADFVQRIVEHTRKATREAKLATSWIQRDMEFEQATERFIRIILGHGASDAFLHRLDRLVNLISPAGALNSLALLTLKVTAPGVPDFYQGMELPRFLLTDPDNRRPVDFASNESQLAALGTGPPEEAITSPTVRLWLTRRLLELRREHRPVFEKGTYEPIAVDGPQSERVFAFGRRHGRDEVVVVVPRLLSPLMVAPGRIPSAAWEGTRVHLSGGGWKHLLLDREEASGDCVALFGQFPTAVIGREQ